MMGRRGMGISRREQEPYSWTPEELSRIGPLGNGGFKEEEYPELLESLFRRRGVTETAVLHRVKLKTTPSKTEV